MKKIETKHGAVLFDDEDYAKFISHGTKLQVRTQKNKASYAYRYLTVAETGSSKIVSAKCIHREVINAKKGEIVDHINGNSLDNRKENLRLCSYSENNVNKGVSSLNTSGAKGVCWCERTKSWQVEIQFNGERKFLGRIKDKDEAIEKYNEEARRLHGEFAKINVP